jgi:hypothetical protein
MKLAPKKVIPYLQIGAGRLGAVIFKAIQAEPQLSSLLLSESSTFTRIDPQLGIAIDAVELPLRIDKLVICIAPGMDKKWRWNAIFCGLVKQVVQQQIVINELIFISSTRVYDGIKQGVVNAKVLPAAQSERAKGLLAAERQLSQLAGHYCFLRCCGLVGEHYQRFQQILKQSDEKVRFAVDTQQVAEKVVERLLAKRTNNQYSIVTDGYSYYRGSKLAFEKSLLLSKHQRLLQNSDYFDC